MMQRPMPCNRFSAAQPNALMPLHVIEQPNQGADPAGTPNDARVQAQEAAQELWADAIKSEKSLELMPL